MSKKLATGFQITHTHTNKHTTHSHDKKKKNITQLRNMRAKHIKEI